MLAEIDTLFPQLAAAINVVGERFHHEAKRARLPAGQFICLEGQACSSLALVLMGTVRVYKSGGSGRELTLYRIEKGGSCILTASCILNQRHFPAFAITETEVEAIVIPAPAFNRWVAEHNAWQHYVFQLLSERLEAVLEVVEEVAFRRLDARLADYLLHQSSQAAHADEVRTTHEAIAAELGSSREVISRLLKDFEREGMVALSRSRIRLQNGDSLRLRAGRL